MDERRTPSGQSPPSPQCAGFRQDLPLLETGALDAARADAVRRHLDACPACRAEWAAFSRAFQAAEQESRPDRPLDFGRILRALRLRIATEPRTPRSGGLPPLPRRWPLWLLLFFLLCLGGLTAAHFIFRDPSPPVVVPPPVLAEYSGADSQIRESLRAGDERTAEKAGARVRLPGGAWLMLSQGARVRVRAAGVLELLQGQAAARLPPASKPLVVVLGRAEARCAPGARATLRSPSASVDAPAVEVAEGEVELQAPPAPALRLTAAQSAARSPDGASFISGTCEPKAVWAWLHEELHAGLALELHADPAPQPPLWSGRLVLRNTGARAVRAAGFHPLGVSGVRYQLELRRPGAAASEFHKLAPLALRRSSPAVVEPLSPAHGAILLQPGESYELDLNLLPLLTERGEYELAAHYLGFAESESEGAGGFSLRSPPVKLTR